MQKLAARIGATVLGAGTALTYDANSNSTLADGRAKTPGAGKWEDANVDEQIRLRCCHRFILCLGL